MQSRLVSPLVNRYWLRKPVLPPERSVFNSTGPAPAGLAAARTAALATRKPSSRWAFAIVIPSPIARRERGQPRCPLKRQEICRGNPRKHSANRERADPVSAIVTRAED